jgi:precorrin-3B synthase
MAAGDGLLVRVKPRVAGISAAQLHALVNAAEAYGSGRIEITNRANFQLRGFTAQTVLGFTEAMRAAELASADPAAERRRNILVVAGLEPDMMQVAQRLEAWLEQDDALRAFPAKFGYAVGVVADVADLCLLPGRVVLPGHVAVPAADPVVMAQALTEAFLRLAPGLTPRPTRLRGLLGAIGLAALRAAAGLEGQDFAPVAFEPRPGGGPLSPAFRLGLAYDAHTAAQLRRAAELATRFGRGWLRTTLDGSLVLLLGTGDDHAGLAEAARAAGFITDPADPRRRVKACVGRPGCASSGADVRAIAAMLAPRWAKAGVLHVSGCTKGCAAPSGAAVTLVATAQEDRFDIVCDERADGVPERAGVSLQDAIEWMTERQFCR